jgi:hypothetical protein
MYPLLFIPPDRFWQLPKVRVTADFFVLGVCIPSGFESDGASIPRAMPLYGLLFVLLAHVVSPWFYVLAFICLLALGVFPRFGLSIKAALLHDYELKQDVNNWWPAGVRFLQQMLMDGVPKVIALLAWFFVTVYQIFFAVIRWCKVLK